MSEKNGHGISCIQLFCDPVDCRLPDSSVLAISQAKHWSGLPFPSPGDLADPGIKHTSPAFAGKFFTTELPSKPVCVCMQLFFRRTNFLVMKKWKVFVYFLKKMLRIYVKNIFKMFSTVYTI